ncbi:MAG: hypothetical protein J7497_09815, partial [Chitinophagaceae bacterium]|nr:hypothetical protein [Chitinophagaceae bacterium]
PGGVLIISTPDKQNYSDKPNYMNKFHIKELYENEFRELVNRYFRHSIFAYQKADFFSLIVPENNKGEFTVYGGDYGQIKMDHALNPIYLISLASDNPVDLNIISIFNDRGIYKSIRQEIFGAFRRSRSYRIGNFILQPAIFLKKLFR